MTVNQEPEAEGLRGVIHGQVCYLQIPAVDPLRSAAFYEAVFGWRIERPHPGFEAPGLIGQWVDDRAPAPDAGPMIWIQVDDIDRALEVVRGNDGEVLELPSPDGPSRMLATIRDPAGNPIGLVRHSHIA
jgi:predicted enzyme related to lactoylglutathione lyase